MTFACLGVFDESQSQPDGGATDGGATSGQLVLSGRPMSACQPGGGDATHHTFAFVPNSASGQLAVLDADHWTLVDFDPTVGGYNQGPLGILPEQIAASDDGCRVVATNRGSCDLTLVDPAALLTANLKAA